MVLLREKNNLEKEEMSKQIYKLQSRETQFVHELRKKELLFSGIQEQFKKLQKEKNIPYLNNNPNSCQNLNNITLKNVFL